MTVLPSELETAGWVDRLWRATGIDRIAEPRLYSDFLAEAETVLRLAEKRGEQRILDDLCEF